VHPRYGIAQTVIISAAPNGPKLATDVHATAASRATGNKGTGTVAFTHGLALPHREHLGESVKLTRVHLNRLQDAVSSQSSDAVASSSEYSSNPETSNSGSGRHSARNLDDESTHSSSGIGGSSDTEITASVRPIYRDLTPRDPGFFETGKEYVFSEWCLKLGTKDRNELAKSHAITPAQKQALVKEARRYKHNISQQTYSKKKGIKPCQAPKENSDE